MTARGAVGAGWQGMREGHLHTQCICPAGELLTGYPSALRPHAVLAGVIRVIHRRGVELLSQWSEVAC
jgi:hypothetical protein